MKKIEAIIRKSRFEDVKKALLAADIEWFPVALFKEACKNEEENINVLFNTLNDAMKELAEE